MDEKKPAVPVKDLIKLHETAKFPIDGIYIRFKDYKWLADFLHGLATSKALLLRAGSAGYTIKPKSKAMREEGFSLLLIGSLVKWNERVLEKIEGQIAEMYLRKGGTGKVENLGMKIIYVLHNSEKALAPYEISSGIQGIFGDEISAKRIGVNLRHMAREYYVKVSRQHNPPYYTLRGEERKFKKALIRA